MKKERFHGFLLIALALVVLALLLVPSLVQKFGVPRITSNSILDASVPTPQETKCMVGVKYAPGKFSYTSRCNDDSCKEKSLDCTLQMQNLDSAGGVFGVVLFLVDDQDRIIATSEQLSSYIAAEDYYEFQATFTGTTASDKCTYQVISVPKKQIC